MQPATMLRRVFAVVVDFLVLYAVVLTVGLSVAGLGHPEFAFLGPVIFVVAIDLPLTALAGLSAGRWAAGIRVVRQSDGRAPGWTLALVRIALVVSTGIVGILYWNFAYYAAHFWGAELGPLRLWWDAAAGTELVRAPRGVAAPVESNFTRR